jgi:hypothetical protein
MNAPHDTTVATGLRGWWASPPRSGMQRLINPIAFRHAHTFGGIHIAGGSVTTIAGVICLSYGAYGWAAFFLILATLNIAGGYWYITIANRNSGRT